MGRAQSGGLLLGLDLDQHPHNITLFHHKVLDAIDLNLGDRARAAKEGKYGRLANRDLRRSSPDFPIFFVGHLANALLEYFVYFFRAVAPA